MTNMAKTTEIYTRFHLQGPRINKMNTNTCFLLVSSLATLHSVKRRYVPLKRKAFSGPHRTTDQNNALFLLIVAITPNAT
jgi:hypothetical protein